MTDFVATRPMSTPLAFRTSYIDLWTPPECAALVESLGEDEWTPIDQHRDDRHFRSVEVQSPDMSVFGDLFHRLFAGLQQVNDELYRFDLAGMFPFDPPHAIRYQPGQGHYGWHMDTGEDHPLRKLSLVVLLNDPSEFDGGSLEIQGWGRLELEVGRAIVFPSFFWHRVHPVTRGIRNVVVAWCQGPTFR